MQDVLDGKVVQGELALQVGHLGGRRLAQRDPDEAVRAASPLGDLLDRDVLHADAFLVNDAIDQHGGSPRRPMRMVPPPSRAPARFIIAA